MTMTVSIHDTIDQKSQALAQLSFEIHVDGHGRGTEITIMTGNEIDCMQHTCP